MGFFSIFKKSDKTEPEQTQEQQDSQASVGFFQKLKEGLSKTSGKLVGGMENIFLGRKEIDEDLLEELEELFITSDVGVETTMKIIDSVRQQVDRKTLKSPEELKLALKEQIFNILNIDNSLVQTTDRPYVMIVVGVNGTGKTTSIAKMAKMFKEQGLKTCLAAGDTFRAAAIDQLCVWADRVDVPVVKQSAGSDSAAVIFDAIQSCKAKEMDVLICDTAGRLQTKVNLMKELEKIIRVAKKELPDAPHEVLLVLDATSGQNALSQAVKFHEDVNLTGIVLTKLDGTAKGGSIIGIVDELKVPVKFIGFGEGIDDLKPFDAKNFVDALFDTQK
ncbi:signal recognition particle-docking protein FtsY [Seleniivibrio woodruffii]|uniref:Signal recognition particle receptor FtsY n=1 Tax=Seleniivibrio woodruffii TaxID=1078050 RepID=A0A4R1K2F2_9BACT|nr:signal recognition particle-docking protein FtsY [Seleniivibrio woodruffii]TCK58206.1 signal recognition particle-docking protein FtsY [Seleniivibrio woodruffii]TVZ35671.1 fused signal recognition particle receptor [Seleniivibrio woodruffii]